jgi:hypothetical protein
MNQELHVALDQADFLAVFPMKGDGFARLVGWVRQGPETQRDSLEWNDVSGSVIERLGIDVRRVNWFSTYHVHHRVAVHFRAGRTFLLGDAAHIHSPVGGQGMNTGIGDALNLAWKLAAVLQGRAGYQLLDSFEPERIAFAQRLVATTDRIFQLVTSDGRLARFVRLHVVPIVFPAFSALNATRRFMFRTASQTAIDYRQSSLSAGVAGKIRGGDRLPWIKLDPPAAGYADNFAPLVSLDWQLHVYGDASPAISSVCTATRLPLHAFPWQEAMASAGFVRGAVYLVRPDGYVGFADRDANVAKLQQYLNDRQIRPREPS